MLDLLIRGGIVVTPEDVGERDVGVQDGTIVAVTSPGPCQRTPDASSMPAAKSSCPAASSHTPTSPSPSQKPGPGAQRS